MAIMEVLDPTGKTADSQFGSMRQPLPRPKSLEGKTVGLLDISKPRGDVFLNEIENSLRDRGANIVRFTKPTFTKPAPVDLRQEIASSCDAVIEALAD